MNLKLDIQPDTQAKLSARATAAGKDVESYVLEVIQEKLAEEVTQSASRRLHGEEWHASLDALLSSLPKISHTVDDSREAIYEGRGE